MVPLRRSTPSLVSLCLSVIGKHLEDIIPELGDIAEAFPAEIKLAVAAIARRRRLLDDDVITFLADGSWEFLDISGSDVSDVGLAKVSEICRSLRAVDISQCNNISPHGLSQLVEQCVSLEILRCGGCRRSDLTIRRCLGLFKPKLNDVEGDSWEELYTEEIDQGGQSLRWLVWPSIDSDSLDILSAECPRINVNPTASPLGFDVPLEAWPDTVLDESMVKDIDPNTWAVTRYVKSTIQHVSNPSELSMAEKFRLAFVERDMRLAPKRAKNARQQQRRAERMRMMSSTEAKAVALASQFSKSLHMRK